MQPKYSAAGRRPPQSDLHNNSDDEVSRKSVRNFHADWGKILITLFCPLFSPPLSFSEPLFQPSVTCEL